MMSMSVNISFYWTVMPIVFDTHTITNKQSYKKKIKNKAADTFKGLDHIERSESGCFVSFEKLLPVIVAVIASDKNDVCDRQDNKYLLRLSFKQTTKYKFNLK